MVVAVKTEPDFVALAPRAVFEAATAWEVFSVSPDGQRFVTIAGQPMPPQVVAIPAWPDELRAKLQTWR